MSETINNRSNDIIALLKKLISIRSYYFEEKEIMEFIYNYLLEKKLNPEFHYYHYPEITNNKGLNIVGKICGQSDNKGKTILLNGHLDTVKICEGWCSDPLSPIIKDNKLYGLGSIDMKSGCVAAIIAIEEFVNTYPKFNGNIMYSFVSDEEGPFGLGTSSLINDGLLNDADVALVLESISSFCKKSFPTVGLGARGGYSYDIELLGKTAHAANPEDGESAIVDAAKLIMELKNIKLSSDSVLGPGSLCITGLSSNAPGCSVADKAVISVFRHTTLGEDTKTILREVEAAAKKADIVCSYNITMREAPTDGTAYYQSYIVDKDNFYVKKLMSTIYDTFDLEANIGYLSSIGDFNYLATRLNIPTIIFGPHGGNFHSPNEYVELNTIIDTTKIIYEFLKNTLL